MTLDELITWSLTDKGKGALLAELKSSCPWLYHDTSKLNFDHVRAKGLEPRDPSQGGPTPLRYQVLREAHPEMVSFAREPNTLPSKGLDSPPLFTLALPAVHFEQFFLDWSFPDMLDMLEPRIRNLEESGVAQATIAKVTAENGVAFARMIPADLLRVKTTATAALMPDKWPLLTATDIEDLWLR